MASVANLADLSYPSDICLLLRAYAEQRWLATELLPHLSDLEGAAVPDEQVGAALAYLEVLWLDAGRRAAETDSAYENLEPQASQRCQVLHERARRYYAAVNRLRADLGARVRRLTYPPPEREVDFWCAR
jgi:hypothetical protein